MSRKIKITATKEEARGALVPKLRFPEFQGVEAWEPATLGAKSSILKGKGISKADLDPNGSQACIRYGELYTRYGETIWEAVSRTKVPASELFLSKPDDVIIPSSGETKIDIAKASCVLVGDIALGGDLNVIRSKLNGTFLSYYLNGPKRLDIAKVAQGDTVVHLYPHQLEALHIAVPKPAEQQKIAECLSSVDELMAVLARKVDALKTHKKGLMQQLFPREGETVPRLRFPEFRNAREWEVKRLSNEVILISGMHLSPDQYSTVGEVPYFTGPSDFTNDIKSVTKWTKRSTNVAMPNDTLITVKGSGVGEVWYSTLSTVAIGRQLMAVRVKQGSSQFIFQFLLTKKTRFVDLGAGNLIPGLSRTDILEMDVHFPAPAEQHRIASCLTTLDALITAETQKLDALKTHKKGLMQQLFPCPEGVEA